MFDYLKKLDPAQRTVSLPMPEITPDAKLIVSYAGKGNTGYQNAVLKAATTRARQVQRGAGAITAEMLEQSHQDDIQNYARFIIKGWEGILDDENEPVPFTRSNCLELLKVLPDHLFQIITRFCSNPSNFTEEADDGMDPEDPTDEQARELAGN